MIYREYLLIFVLLGTALLVSGQQVNAGFLGRFFDNTRRLFGLGESSSTPKPVAVANTQPVSSTGGSQVSTTTVHDTTVLLNDAKLALQQGTLKKAADLFLKVLDVDPLNIEANSLLGATFLALREPQMAEGFLFSAVKQSNWKDLISIGNLAECLRLNGDLVMAEKVALHGLNENNNKDPTGLVSFALGVIAYDQQKYAVAADWYLASAIAQGTNIEAWLRASTVAYPVNFRDYKFAENVLIEGIKINPKDPRLALYLAVALHSTGRLKEATVLYEQTLAADPTNKDASSGLAMIRQSLGRIV